MVVGMDAVGGGGWVDGYRSDGGRFEEGEEGFDPAKCDYGDLWTDLYVIE